MIKYLLFLIILCSCQSEKTDLYAIKKFIDGDTIIVEDGSAKGMTIRLIGINAPESRDFKHRKKEPFGEEASNKLESIIGTGKVRIEFDIEKFDKYGRTLAYLYTADSVFVNNEMIKTGYAQVMTFPPNVRYVALFTQSQLEARQQGLGIWENTK